jgi:hypothetical protein
MHHLAGDETNPLRGPHSTLKTRFALEIERLFGISFPSPPTFGGSGFARKQQMTPRIRLTVVVRLVGLDAGGIPPV